MVEGADKRPRVLLTGFGPFPGVPTNASAALVRNVVRPARRAFPQFRFVISVLPTEWRRGPQRVAALHKRYQPVLSLHFGVASGPRSIRLETQGNNVCIASPDATGLPPLAARLEAEGPDVRSVTVDTAAIADVMKHHGWPCTISNDAGGYLCNAVFYHSLASANVHGGAVGFVHIPTDLSVPPLQMPELTAATLEIIRVALTRANATVALV